MRSSLFSLSGARTLMMAAAVLGLSAGVSGAADAAALFTLKGNTPAAKLESESELRLSVLGWTSDEQASAIVDEFQRYQQSQDHAAFQNFLQMQETRGYLFTKEATGHTIKYAWQDVDAERMVLMVIPALKTRNPYMWKERNENPAPFSLLELHLEGDAAVMKTSLDAPVAVEGGRLQLQDFGAAEAFATLQDDTPYYLKTAGWPPGTSE